jgi:hypothetical protein
LFTITLKPCASNEATVSAADGGPSGAAEAAAEHKNVAALRATPRPSINVFISFPILSAHANIY